LERVLEMEKRLHKLAKLLLVLGLIPMLSGVVKAQGCTAAAPTVNAGSITPTISWQTIPCVRAGEYYVFNAVAGERFTFSYCIMGGGAYGYDTELTMLYHATGLYANGYADDQCTAGSWLWYWTAPATGQFRVLTTEFPCLTTPNFCSTLAYKKELPTATAGVNCGNPWVIPSLPYAQTGLTTCFFNNDYVSGNGCTTPYLNGQDFVMTFSGTAGQCLSIFTRNTFTYASLFLMNGCPNVVGTTCVAAAPASAGNPQITNVTLPSTGTYYIVMDKNPSPTPNCTPFDIEVLPCIAVGQGQTCATAFTIPALPYTQSGFTTCGRGNTYTSAMVCGSPYMDGDDFLFRYNSPGNECIAVEVTNSQAYTGFFVYNGCPDVVGTSCIAMREEPGGNPKLRNIYLTAPGTYYIMVSTWPAPQCTQFNMSVKPCTPGCTRNPNAADNCLAPTLVNLGLNDTVCGYSNYTYTPDVSTDLSTDFCGSIENNGWFSFVADSTQMTLQFNVSNCLSGYGIQARVFESPDCINYTPVSNCWNPMIQANGVVRATGLTVGNTYFLMIDGYATDDCEFNIFRIRGPLPVEWGQFKATSLGETVKVDWSTMQEVEARGFFIQRGRRSNKALHDNFTWESIGFVPSRGSISTGATYTFTDSPEFTNEPLYYRVQLLDNNGNSDFTDFQRVELWGPDHGQLRKIYPNPAADRVTVEYYSAKAGTNGFALFNLAGMLVKQVNFDTQMEGVFTRSIELEHLNAGLYIYVVSINGQITKGKLDIQK
jgi:hypothetical protein